MGGTVRREGGARRDRTGQGLDVDGRGHHSQMPRVACQSWIIIPGGSSGTFPHFPSAFCLAFLTNCLPPVLISCLTASLVG